jgi:xanthine dehydrogenase accessory factor
MPTENPNQISEAILNLLSEGRTAVLATLMRAPESNSSALEVGAKLLIAESGERVGSLGDGEVEETVAHHVGSFLNSRLETKTLGSAELAPQIDALRGAAILFERIEAEPRLIICGAGHVGASLARLGALVGYRITLIDDRAEFVSLDLFSSHRNIELVLAEDWADAVRNAIGNGRGASVAIVTRGHKQDEDCLRAVMAARPDYVGMIGSKRRTNIVLDKLREEGAQEELLKQVRAPIGLDIGAVSPEEVALAILAEIIAERRSGSGAPLSAWRRSNQTL